MEFVLWLMINLPIIFMLVGAIFLVMYLYNSVLKKTHIKSYLIIGCVLIGLVVLSFVIFFIIGLMGIGPIPN